MPNGSKQYQQTESDCIRNSDGNAFGRNIVCQHRRQHEKSDPQRDFRQQGLSPGWFGAIRRASAMIHWSWPLIERNSSAAHSSSASIVAASIRSTKLLLLFSLAIPS